MKTKDLTGAALDWAVAKCAGYVEQGVYGTPEFRDGEVYLCYCDVVLNSCYSPTTNWAQGGPIIEGEHLQSHWAGPVLGYAAMHPDCKKYSYGPTMLIAAMRCFVASRLGDEVTVPEALL